MNAEVLHPARQRKAAIVMLENEVEGVFVEPNHNSPLLLTNGDANNGVEPQKGIGKNSRHQIREPSPIEDSIDVMNQPISVIRHNLLGNLTFDDLYYL